MLRSLYIRDFALIEELNVSFGEGLNIITGETGAGKSILIGALKLILGERASTETIRSGTKKAIIEGVFDGTDTPAISKLLADYDYEPTGQIILRREISTSQSRAFINDTPATLPVIREVANQLIDLHGQHEHQLLLRPETHLATLDHFGQHQKATARYQDAYQQVANMIRERDELRLRADELAKQKELFDFQSKEIDEVAPIADEEDALEAECRRLEHAEKLHEATSRLSSVLYEDDQALHDRLSTVKNELDQLSSIDETFKKSTEEAQSACIIVAELAQSLQSYADGIEFNPERLQELRQRIGALDSLKRKYGGTLEAVIAYRDEIGEALAIANDSEEKLERLDGEIETGRTILSEAAMALTKTRQKTASQVQKAIIKEMATLGMPNSRFEVRIGHHLDPKGWITSSDGQRYAAYTHGMDDVAFFISTNPGESLRPLAKVASGGEISRIMLALKSILARSERLPILVFDEIDTGISGVVARQVGHSMHNLAQSHQIIAITHLPQIAALGNHHFRVEKQVAGGRTKTHIKPLNDVERTKQIATLISGNQITEAALESARELMTAGRS